jgi:hypothetical protein
MRVGAGLLKMKHAAPTKMVTIRRIAAISKGLDFGDSTPLFCRHLGLNLHEERALSGHRNLCVSKLPLKLENSLRISHLRLTAPSLKPY